MILPESDFTSKWFYLKVIPPRSDSTSIWFHLEVIPTSNWFLHQSDSTSKQFHLKVIPPQVIPPQSNSTSKQFHFKVLLTSEWFLPQSASRGRDDLRFLVIVGLFCSWLNHIYITVNMCLIIVFPNLYITIHAGRFGVKKYVPQNIIFYYINYKKKISYSQLTVIPPQSDSWLKVIPPQSDSNLKVIPSQSDSTSKWFLPQSDSTSKWFHLKVIPPQSDSTLKWFYPKVIPPQNDSTSKWFLPQSALRGRDDLRFLDIVGLFCSWLNHIHITVNMCLIIVFPNLYITIHTGRFGVKKIRTTKYYILLYKL